MLADKLDGPERAAHAGHTERGQRPKFRSGTASLRPLALKTGTPADLRHRRERMAGVSCSPAASYGRRVYVSSSLDVQGLQTLDAQIARLMVSTRPFGDGGANSRRFCRQRRFARYQLFARELVLRCGGHL